MISKIKNLIQKKEKDNRGAALVMVIVAIAFIGMLVGMVLYMAYCNYLMKNNDKIAKNNFYSAEYVLDILNAGLQHDVSEAMSLAYVEVMSNSKGMTSDDMSKEFRKLYLDKIIEKLQYTDGTDSYSDQWSVDHLKEIWDNSGVNVAAAPGAEGAYICAVNDINEMKKATSEKYITLSNLQIVYTDERGFVSIITTDLRIKTPDINFAQSATKMNVETFSIIANNSLVNDNNKTKLPDAYKNAINPGSDAAISGNVFGGYDGVDVANQKRIRFVQNQKDKDAGSVMKYNLIAESLNVDNASEELTGLVVDNSFETFVNNISVSSGYIDLDGETYVGDDMDIAGKSSNVILKGKYRGYGKAYGVSEGSSSILINGSDTTLDFSGLEELVLSGHAYVGAKKYDADVDRLAYASNVGKADLTSDKITDMDEYNQRLEELKEAEDEEGTTEEEATEGEETEETTGEYKETKDSIPRNEMDVMMGESISVKANQLLYMVPSECVGYKVGTNTQVIAKNPLTYKEYEELVNTTKDKVDADGNKVTDPLTGEVVKEKVYEPVRLSVLWDRLGAVSFTNDYRAVYRRVNGNVLVYLYMDFGANEAMANEFYKAYYEYDKEGIESYVKSYIKDMVWSSELSANNGANLTLGGNAFRFDDDDELVFIEDSTLNSDKYLNMITMQDLYGSTYESLMHTLSKNYKMMSGEQSNTEIFDNLTDDSKLTEFNGAEFKDDAGTVYAKISDSDVVYPDDCEDGTALIVAKGNVFLRENFEGLVMAGENVYICSGCSAVDYNPSLVLQALRTKAKVGGAEVYAYEVFGNSGVISYGLSSGGTEASDDTIDLGDLITYENWKKE